MRESVNLWIPDLSGEPKERPGEAHERQRGLLERLETVGHGLAALAQIHEVAPNTQVHYSVAVTTNDPSLRAEQYITEPGWTLAATEAAIPDTTRRDLSVAMLSKNGHICVTTVLDHVCEIQEPGMLPEISLPEGGFFDAQQVGPAMRGSDAGKRGSLTVDDVALGCVAFNETHALGANLDHITELLHRDDPSVR
ncbi:MAG TPA: hypothetical protein VHT70_00250 [Candidatus Saccharimonadales bacterium]|jgi:hypothetical protein|nr:hypothetical protein [Candidatus Saccharimonadales bacterium]